METLKPVLGRFFIFDPLDDKDSPPFLKRNDILQLLQETNPISKSDFTDLFRTVLGHAEEIKLIKIC